MTEPTSYTGWSPALVDPNNATRQLGPLSGVVTVGRSDADIVLDDPAISRTHLTLATSGADLIVRDLASSYGTFLNGNRVDAPTRLASGDRITLGNSTLLVTQKRPTSQPARRQEQRASVADSSTQSSAPQPPAPQESMGALIRINEVLNAEEEGEESELLELGPLSQDLRLVGLSFSYGPERKALDAIDVTISAGSKVAFVGPSGSGKSTVLRMLMRQYDPDEGAFLIDSVDVRQRSLASLRDQTGVVFQDSFLLDTTIRENIGLGKPGATAAEAAEIDEFIDQLPRGYDTVVDDAGGNLSGGQRQRVAIARALVRDPCLLLLDEATSALDPRTESQINKTFDRIAANRTTVSITHRLTSVVEHDRIYVVDAEAVVEQGTHDELLKVGGLYARLWAEQTGSKPPDTAPFDMAAAVGAIPLFSSLDAVVLAAFVDRLGSFDLAAGDSLEDGGGVVVVESGTGQVMVTTAHGDRAVSADLGPGDAYGVAAVLGGHSTGLLLATTPMRLHHRPRPAPWRRCGVPRRGQIHSRSGRGSVGWTPTPAVAVDAWPRTQARIAYRYRSDTGRGGYSPNNAGSPSHQPVTTSLDERRP